MSGVRYARAYDKKFIHQLCTVQYFCTSLNRRVRCAEDTWVEDVSGASLVEALIVLRRNHATCHHQDVAADQFTLLCLCTCIVRRGRRVRFVHNASGPNNELEARTSGPFCRVQSPRQARGYDDRRRANSRRPHERRRRRRDAPPPPVSIDVINYTC